MPSTRNRVNRAQYPEVEHRVRVSCLKGPQDMRDEHSNHDIA